MNTRTARTLRHCLLLLVLAVSLSGTAPVHAAQADAAPAPLSIRVSAIATTPGSISFAGSGFSAGQPVYIALYDAWGTRLLETRWTASSTATYGPNGSIDPALGYHAGGSVLEIFESLCGVDALIRAYDQHTATWSTWSTVNDSVTRCANA